MDLPGNVTAAVRERLPAAAAAAFLATARPSVGFTIRGDGSERGSVLFGAPRTVPFGWPEYDGEPMLLLAQIDCAQVAALLGPDWPFPVDGYLLFFHDDEFEAGYDPENGDDGCHVMHVAAASGDEGPWYRDEDDDGEEWLTHHLDAAAMPSLPGFEDYDDLAGFGAAGEMLSADIPEALRRILPAPRHRLLGYCDTVTPRPAGLRPLLQFEAEEGAEWGETVNVSFWISDDDLRAGRLDDVRRAYEVA